MLKSSPLSHIHIVDARPTVLTKIMERAEEFAIQFLQDHGVDYKEAIDNYTAVETHKVAEAGTRKFLEQGGDIQSEKDVYGMILDGLRGQEQARLEKKSLNFQTNAQVLKIV